ncbi:tetratricopeptide repeat protein [Corallococcus sp. AS-1-12]|uniref:tetratricopeptide repeat protein n=1 Tax=Corallococcus sp. AS-1-12 TaxID=2874598 RepID=UPI001CC166DB|nr:tetratricopeptide repeat protein [Corallococcus sp. AS-1-12]MBZ4331364.1 tetratricopeptide repeat protein [Corallococcus sp. AS-1-12]
MAHRLRILHLSDTQFRASPTSNAWRTVPLLGEAWERNLDTISTESPVDLVVCTGDVAFSGQVEEYAVATQFIDATLRQLELKRECFFVTPGNHDINRAIAREAWSQARQQLKKNQAKAISRWIEGAPLNGLAQSARDQLLERQSAYRNWISKDLGRTSLVPADREHPPLGYRVSLQLPKFPFEVHAIGLDSAWLAGDDKDQGSLWLTESQIRNLGTDAHGDPLIGFRLALMHHPTNYLADPKGSLRLLAKSVDLLLHGHLHAYQAKLQSKLPLTLVAGSLHTRTSFPQTCETIDIWLDDHGIPQEVDVWVRRWSAQAGWTNDSQTYKGSKDGRLQWQSPETKSSKSTDPLADSLRTGAKSLLQGADSLHKGGDLDSALRILRDQVIPIYERLNDIRARAIALTKAADILEQRGDYEEALSTLREKVLPVFEQLGDARSRALALGKIADILEQRGDYDEALRIRLEEEIPVYERIKDVRSRAIALSKIANILEQRGNYDEALRIHREEVLPVFERLGDIHSRALALGKVAEILGQRGNYDEALRILREEALPVFERLVDVRARAVAIGKVADILEHRGDYDEALRIRREEEIPVYERLGDVHSRAVAIGQVADILQQRGDYDEALRIRREEELPVYERLGDVRLRAVALGQVADILQQRGDYDEALRIHREEALPIFERLGDVRSRAVSMSRVADILQRRKDYNEALRIHREEALPVFERLGDIRSRAVTLGKIADILQTRGDLDEAFRIRQQEELPVYKRLGDIHSQAVTLEKVSEILTLRGNPSEALHILRQDVLPIWKKLSNPEEHQATLKNIVALKHSLRKPTFSIQSLSIRNIKNISSISIDFTPTSSLPGQWRCIAGINGAGKSTVLQAVACALLGERLVTELGGERLQRMRRRSHPIENSSEIELRISNSRETFDLLLPLGPDGIDLKKLEAHENYKAMREFWEWRAQNHLLVSYGAGRNLSEHVQVGIGQDKSRDVQRQFTLFEPLASVAHAEVLTHQDRLQPAAFRALQFLLDELLSDSPVQVLPDSGMLQFRVEGATVTTTELPDGFRALITWLADLCASWQEKAPEEAELGDISLLQGIVLIDEIDLHLHPRLQRTIVPRLRRLLPGVQWIATTHSPLVLASFDRNEIIPLQGLSGQARPPLDRQILGFSTDEIYRWLMETEPSSAELDALWENRQDSNKGELGLILAQSPDMNDEDARQAREWRRQRLEEVRRKKQDGEP